MKVKHALLIFIAIIGTLTFSCSKKKLKNKLQGKWELIDMTRDIKDSTGVSSTIYWYINESQIVITQDNGVEEDTVDIGSFILKIKLETKEFSAKGFGEKIYSPASNGGLEYRENFYNDKWKVDRLDDEILSIYSNKDNNFQYFDFLKVE